MQDTQTILPKSQRRRLAAIALIGFVIWAAFAVKSLTPGKAVPEAGPEVRRLAARHHLVELSSPLANPGRLDRERVGR